MKCEVCGQHEATVFVKQVADGTVRKLQVCAKCAEKKGLDVQLPIPFLVDCLFGQGGERQANGADGGKTCPACNLRRSQFRKTSLFGCATCYETFPDEVATFLDGMPECRGHVGKVPSREKLTAEVALLETRLREAVVAQNYEAAAQLRDQLRDAKLQGGVQAGNPGA